MAGWKKKRGFFFLKKMITISKLSMIPRKLAGSSLSTGTEVAGMAGAERSLEVLVKLWPQMKGRE